MAKVIYASGKDSDMLYEIKMHIPDPFFFIDTGKGKYVFLDHREFNVFKKKNKNSQIETILLNPFVDKTAQIKDNTSIDNKIALLLFRKYRLLGRQVDVPTSFPLDMADYLRSKGAKLNPTAPFYADRRIKDEDEIKKIQQGLKGSIRYLTGSGKFLPIQKLAERRFYMGDDVVTSELLKWESDKVLLENDMANVEGMIISSGADAAIPHHLGEGVIKPHTTIICDIFPQNRTTKYFADLTRTFVKGTPTDEVVRMYRAVLKAQKAGIDAVKPGAKGSEVHNACVKVFLAEGFHVGDKGFVHGTGHSLGIDVHEGPYLNRVSQEKLESGNVITVEPGLYYPKWGGVRIEDDVLVTKNGHKNLTNYPKELIIP